ncbi:hypothetical protein [Prevotella histicola]|jgi:hypothetical protein|uniref:hypothetical protein n=1 Tax=Prevotella histicola TaxID=470565 RepID=UPI001C5D28CA|nr:hypothetical protein [Prevotella histicola]MBS6662115.1 hypothetical protein [Prevotella histicola]MBW4757684.1 hypothetical protein [Prevotella histicola]
MENMANELTDKEMYRLKDGVMYEHFKGFDYKWNENRIYCAKVTKEGEYQWIKWSDNKGYDLNSIKRGDIIMLQKMHPKRNRTKDKIYYKVISRTKNKIIAQWANGDIVYTTYKKALKAPLPRVKEL